MFVRDISRLSFAQASLNTNIVHPDNSGNRTCSGGLSSRRPRKTGWRSFRSAVPFLERDLGDEPRGEKNYALFTRRVPQRRPRSHVWLKFSIQREERFPIESCSHFADIMQPALAISTEEKGAKILA